MQLRGKEAQDLSCIDLDQIPAKVHVYIVHHRTITQEQYTTMLCIMEPLHKNTIRENKIWVDLCCAPLNHVASNIPRTPAYRKCCTFCCTLSPWQQLPRWCHHHSNVTSWRQGDVMTSWWRRQFICSCHGDIRHIAWRFWWCHQFLCSYHGNSRYNV